MEGDLHDGTIFCFFSKLNFFPIQNLRKINVFLFFMTQPGFHCSIKKVQSCFKKKSANLWHDLLHQSQYVKVKQLFNYRFHFCITQSLVFRISTLSVQARYFPSTQITVSAEMIILALSIMLNLKESCIV